jgi:hypothetical protein
MKQILLILAIATGIQSLVAAQTRLNAGIGYYGENVANPGFVLEFEIEKHHSALFSLPLRGNLGYHSNPDYHAFTLDIHKGFRKYFSSGLFLEQSVGAGLITKSFKEADYWYADKYMTSIAHGNKPTWGFMPSVTVGAGYNLAAKNEASRLLWIRPKVYWDLGFRGLELPYFALQLGYTHTFKTK